MRPILSSPIVLQVLLIATVAALFPLALYCPLSLPSSWGALTNVSTHGQVATQVLRDGNPYLWRMIGGTYSQMFLGYLATVANGKSIFSLFSWVLMKFRMSRFQQGWA
jgi:hypothetical protein